MRKITSLLILTVISILISSCENKESAKYIGNWEITDVYAFERHLPVKTCEGFDMTLYDDEKAEMTIDGKNYDATWSLDDSEIIITIKENDWIILGHVNETQIILLNVFNHGADITFEKE